MMVRRIRGGSGLGDSIYLRPIVEHFIRAGDTVEVMSDYPGVFDGSGATVEAFGRNNINVLAHYSWNKSDKSTKQWDDICKCARLPHTLPLSFDWRIRNHKLVDRVVESARGKPIILLHGGRIPMGRKDGFGKELLPEQSAFHNVLREMADCYSVRIGQAYDQVYAIPANESLTGQSVTDLLDLARVCSAVIGQCSFAVPLAEVFDKPLLAVWAQWGLDCNSIFINAITPQKVLYKQTSRFVVDSWDPAQQQKEAREFRQLF